MEVLWARQASDDYGFWLANDEKIAQRIRDLITDIQRHPFQGIGKPEPLLARLEWLLVAPHHRGASARLSGRRQAAGAYHCAVPTSLPVSFDLGELLHCAEHVAAGRNHARDRFGLAAGGFGLAGGFGFGLRGRPGPPRRGGRRASSSTAAIR